MELRKLRPEKCKVCKQYKQAHYKQSYYVIAEYNDESKDWEVTFKDVTGNPRNIELDCNDSTCKGSKYYVER